MTTRYVGPGGNDGNSGLTWALRKLTLNGVEDTPVVAGDTVYVGPGVYREYLIFDVSGGVGTQITYIGDITGENTDGVGGVVRITGSDNDQTQARAVCITFQGRAYRTIRGFRFDGWSSACLNRPQLSGIIIEDCVFEMVAPATHVINTFDSGAIVGNIIRRCVFLAYNSASNNYFIYLMHSSALQDADWLIENCIFDGLQWGRQIHIVRVDGVVVKNNIFMHANYGLSASTLVGGGGTCTAYNNLFYGLTVGVVGGGIGDITEDYNNFDGNGTDRQNTNVGGNSVAYLPLLDFPVLFDEIAMPLRNVYGHSEWSSLIRITGSAEAADDLFGRTRPVTAAKNSWGAIQFQDMERETGTVRTGSVSMVLHDAGRHQIWVPVTATSTTIKVYVYREANYAGNLPQMIIKQPGVADDVTTDVGAAGSWNLLTTTLVPAADPPYVVVELVSRNTAVALAYETFFDDLDVS